jgi:hypothetical protein
MASRLSFSRIDDDIDFNRGGWEDAGVAFHPPASQPPPPPPKARGGALANPFEEKDPSAWEAQLASARFSDPLADLEKD